MVLDQTKPVAKPGAKTVAFFAKTVGTDERVARRFLVMCGTLRSAITCYYFCPTLTPGPNCAQPWNRYSPGVKAGNTRDPTTCPCSLCGRPYITGHRVRVCGYNTERKKKCHGSIYQFPKDLHNWQSLKLSPRWYCTGCWLHAVAERERTPHCPQSGSVPIAILRTKEYRESRSKSLTWVEANLFKS